MSVRYRTCTACKKNRAAKFFKANGKVCLPCQKKRAARANKDRRIRATYNITIEEYETILAFQGGVCAGCGGTRKVFDIDHDHAMEKEWGTRMSVRGLLCRSCNKVLAYVRDNADRLRDLAMYLDNPPAWLAIEGRGYPV